MAETGFMVLRCRLMGREVDGVAFGSGLILLRRTVELQDAAGMNFRPPALDRRCSQIPFRVLLGFPPFVDNAFPLTFLVQFDLGSCSIRPPSFT
jgi:hypothetical protein